MCYNGADTDFDYAAVIKIYSPVGSFAKRAKLEMRGKV